MGEDLLATLALDNTHTPSTLLSMDSCNASVSSTAASDDAAKRDTVFLSSSLARLPLPPPDINLPLFFAADISSEFLDTGALACHLYDAAAAPHAKGGAGSRKLVKRCDSIWGAWFFFSFYFKPVLSDKCKGRVVVDGHGVSGFDRSDVRNDVFLVQHDMENMYMWAFKDHPENALGKMQLRSYMNGHSRPGEPQFPFSIDRGFLRSHRMQRKHYRGLSNPQCIHGIEVVRSPNLSAVAEVDCKRWTELTGRDPSLAIPKEAGDFASWRNQHHPELDLDAAAPLPLPALKTSNGARSTCVKKSGSNLNLSPSSQDDGMDVSPPASCKRRHDEEEKSGQEVEMHTYAEPGWMSEFKGVMRNAAWGPVTAAKSIYEDAEAYLIVVSLPFADQKRVKVSWRNTEGGQGVVKVGCVSTAGAPYVRRRDRVFKLTDPSSEHCPPGEFVREIALPTRIPEEAKLEAYFEEGGTALEILVPKHSAEPEEHEVRVCVRPRSL